MAGAGGAPLGGGGGDPESDCDLLLHTADSSVRHRAGALCVWPPAVSIALPEKDDWFSYFQIEDTEAQRRYQAGSRGGLEPRLIRLQSLPTPPFLWAGSSRGEQCPKGGRSLEAMSSCSWGCAGILRMLKIAGHRGWWLIVKPGELTSPGKL